MQSVVITTWKILEYFWNNSRTYVLLQDTDHYKGGFRESAHVHVLTNTFMPIFRIVVKANNITSLLPFQAELLQQSPALLLLLLQIKETLWTVRLCTAGLSNFLH